LRSRPEPFRTLAKTVRQPWQGILAYFQTGLTSAAIEAVDTVIQLAKRMARVFKNFVYFNTAAYLQTGRLQMRDSGYQLTPHYPHTKQQKSQLSVYRLSQAAENLNT
jgi:hypothetical protein